MNVQVQLQWRREPTKSYTTRITKDVWEAHQNEIISRYKSTTLEKTISWMNTSFNLHTSYASLLFLEKWSTNDTRENQLRRQLQKWGVKKYKKGTPESLAPAGTNLLASAIASPLTSGSDVHGEVFRPLEVSGDSYGSTSMPENGLKRNEPDAPSVAEHASKRPRLLGPTRRNAIRRSTTRDPSCLQSHLSVHSEAPIALSRKLSFEVESSEDNVTDVPTSTEAPLAQDPIVGHVHLAELERLDQDAETAPISSAETIVNSLHWEASDHSTLTNGEGNQPSSSLSSPMTCRGAQMPLIISLAGATLTWLPGDMKRVRHAADFLFSCGLSEDAFPLYVLLWKELDASTSLTVLRHSVVLSCWRSATTDLHKSIVINMLEKELDDQREALAIHYTSPLYAPLSVCLFRLLWAQTSFLQTDPERAFNILESVSREFSTLNELIHHFLVLRKYNPKFGARGNGFSIYPRAWMLESIAPKPNFLKPVLHPTTGAPLTKSQVEKLQKQVLQYQLPSLLSSPAFFDYDIAGLVRWCGSTLQAELTISKDATITKLTQLFRQYQFRPEIALAFYFWEMWQRFEPFEEKDSHLHQEYSKKAPKSLESYVGPRTIGLDSVSIAELLVVVSSIMLEEKLFGNNTKSIFSRNDISGEKLLEFIQGHYIRLASLDHEELHASVRNRHLLMIEFQWQGAAPRPLARQALRRMVEECLNIILPVNQPSSSVPLTSKLSSNSFMFSSTSGEVDKNPTLARSLRPSEDSSFRRFASHARRSVSKGFSQSSRRSTRAARTSTAAGSSTRQRSIMTDELSASFGSLNISDSDHVAILGLNQMLELE